MIPRNSSIPPLLAGDTNFAHYPRTISSPRSSRVQHVSPVRPPLIHASSSGTFNTAITDLSGERLDDAQFTLEPPYVQTTTIWFNLGTEYDQDTNSHPQASASSHTNSSSRSSSRHPLSRCCLYIQKGLAYHMTKRRTITNREHISTLVPFTFAHSVPFKMEMMLYAKDTRYERHKIYIQVTVRENYKIDEALSLERQVHLRKATGKWTVRHAPIVQVNGPTEIELFVLEKRIHKLFIQQSKLEWRQQIRSGTDFSERTPSVASVAASTDSALLTRDEWDALYGGGGGQQAGGHLALGAPSNAYDRDSSRTSRLPLDSPPQAPPTHRSLSTNDMLKSARSVHTIHTALAASPRTHQSYIPDWDASSHPREFDRTKYAQRPRKYSVNWRGANGTDPNQYDRDELFRTLQEEHEELLQKMLESQEHPPTTTEEFLRRQQQRTNGEGLLPREGENTHLPTPPRQMHTRRTPRKEQEDAVDSTPPKNSPHTGSPFTVRLNHSLSSTPSPQHPQQQRTPPTVHRQHAHSPHKPSLMHVGRSSSLPVVGGGEVGGQLGQMGLARRPPQIRATHNSSTTTGAPYEPQKPSSPRIRQRGFGMDSRETGIQQRRAHEEERVKETDWRKDVGGRGMMDTAGNISQTQTAHSDHFPADYHPNSKPYTQPTIEPTQEEPFNEDNNADIYAGFEDWRSKQSTISESSHAATAGDASHIHQPLRSDPPQIRGSSHARSYSLDEQHFFDDDGVSIEVDTMQDDTPDDVHSVASSNASVGLTTSDAKSASSKSSRVLFRRADISDDLLNRLNSFAFDEF